MLLKRASQRQVSGNNIAPNNEQSYEYIPDQNNNSTAGSNSSSKAQKNDLVELKVRLNNQKGPLLDSPHLKLSLSGSDEDILCEIQDEGIDGDETAKERHATRRAAIGAVTPQDVVGAH